MHFSFLLVLLFFFIMILLTYNMTDLAVGDIFLCIFPTSVNLININYSIFLIQFSIKSASGINIFLILLSLSILFTFKTLSIWLSAFISLLLSCYFSKDYSLLFLWDSLFILKVLGFFLILLKIKSIGL